MDPNTHMTLADIDGIFTETVCGIVVQDQSEEFQKHVELSDLGDESSTTCKQCLSKYKRLCNACDSCLNSMDNKIS